jgi:hypothetical protein
MPQNFLSCDREQVLLMPPSLREWLPENHLAWFVLSSVKAMDLAPFYVSYRSDGHGRPAHDPAMMVALLLYAYCKGQRSSRVIEHECVEDIAYRGHAQSTSFHVEYGPLGGATTTTAEQPLGVTGADTPVSLALTGLHPATAYQARVVVTNPTGSTAGAFVTFTTAPSSLAAPAAPAAPVLSSVRESATKWRAGGKLAQISSRHGRGKHRPPVGTTFSFSLNEQASVTFAFTQRVSGRKVIGKCLAQTNRNRHKRVCKRTVTRGTLSFSGHSGVNKVSFQGLISRSKKLPLGSYTLVITASSAVGQRSTPKQLEFTIVK